MNASRKPRGAKWWTLWTLGLLLCLTGGTLAYLKPNSFAIECLGILAILAGVYIAVRAPAARSRPSTGGRDHRSGGSGMAGRSSRAARNVGIGLLLLGLVLFAAGFLDRGWATLGYGLLCAMAGTLLVRISFDRPLSPDTESGGEETPKAISLFDRLMRSAGIALVPLAALSLASLYLDAIRGYHESWPLYTFFVVALVSALVWPYLFARAFGKLLRR